MAYLKNPLENLKIYRSIKNLRAYYVSNVHRGINNDLKHTVGRMLLEEMCHAVNFCAVVDISRSDEEKLTAMKSLLMTVRTITDKVQMLSEDRHSGVTLKQAVFMYEILIDIEEQARLLAKTFANMSGKSQSPQPTGQGESSSADEGSSPLI